MLDRIVQLIDPELILPSQTAAESEEFWNRLIDCIEDPALRIGPASLEALELLMNSRSNRWAISEGDFWSVMSMFASRGTAVNSDSPRPICDHLEDDYSPVLGAASNFSTLRRDLVSIPPQLRIALATIEDCWQSTQRYCEKCISSRLSRMTVDHTERSRLEILRTTYLELHPGSIVELKNNAKYLFPAIIFSNTAWNHISTISGNIQETVDRLVKHLGCLNDFAPHIWATEDTVKSRQRAFIDHDITCSPEKGTTHKNKKAMNARKFQFGPYTLECEWHTKLWRHKGRIYFDVKDRTVYVGVMTDHLLL